MKIHIVEESHENSIVRRGDYATYNVEFAAAIVE